MFKLNCGVALLGTVAALMAFAAPAHAAADQTYVASTGVDTGTTCDRAAPCRTFQYAHDQTNSGGQITALDAADYEPVTITKSITVRANSEEASIFVTTGNAITINAPNLGVALQGLTLRGSATAGNGIFVQAVGHLGVYSMRASQFQGAAPNGFGIKINSNVGSRYILQGLSLNGNGNAANSTGGAIQISPASGGTAQALIDNVTGSRNVFGVAVDGTGSTGGMNVTIRNSIFTHSRVDGVIATTPPGGAPIGVLVERSALHHNINGARAFGSGVTIRLLYSSIVGNGLGVGAGSGGVVQSYGNNAINANGTDGTPTLISLK